MFIDSHCHFDFSVFDHDREKVWREALEAGVKGLVIPGVAPAQWAKAHAIASGFAGCRYAVGIHPWWVKAFSADVLVGRTGIVSHSDSRFSKLHSILSSLYDHAKNNLCVAIGECGLDKTIDLALDVQTNYLDEHLAIAQELHMPVILHCVKAHNELLTCLKRHNFTASNNQGVLHAFSGSPELAKSYWEKGLALGIGGTITYPRANKTRQAVAELPQDAILLETDAPDMPLQGQQGKRNEPKYIIDVAECLADLRGESVLQISDYVLSNLDRIFCMGERR